MSKLQEFIDRYQTHRKDPVQPIEINLLDLITLAQAIQADMETLQNQVLRIADTQAKLIEHLKEAKS